jgi:hypothetical protein
VARKRTIIISVITAFVVVFGWVGVLVGLQLWSSGGGHNFRTETATVLTRLGDPEKVDAVYDEASPMFRQLVIRERFYEMVEEMNATLGPFQEVVSARETERIDGPGGRTGRLLARVRFERGETLGNFSFHSIDGQWRLLGLSVDLPEGVTIATPTGEALRVRIEAPAEVMDQVAAIFEQIRNGQAGAVYDQAAVTLRESIEREKFLDFIENRQQAMGGFVRIFDIIKSKQHPNKHRATVILALEYGETRTTGTLDFVKSEDENWRLSGLKIIVPEPLVPERPTEAPEGRAP